MASKRNVQYLQPEVPTFLKKFKERVGYKEPSTIEDKFADNFAKADEEHRGSEEENREEESPVVVVLRSGDMTAEEVDEYKQEQSENEKGWDTVTNKPVFKKPIKRTSGEKETQKKGSKRKKTNDNKVKKVKNTTLLSFDEDDEETF